MPEASFQTSKLFKFFKKTPTVTELLLAETFTIIEHSSEKAGFLERLQLYVTLLEKGETVLNKKDKLSAHFLLAFYYQYLTNKAQSKEEAKQLLAKSLENFQDFMKGEPGHGEQYFYAQFQIALQQQLLKYDWPKVLESFLDAHALNPLRGEAIKQIIKHYMSTKQWPLAYIFSSFGKDHYFGKNPYPKIKWIIDAHFYNWQVLDYHIFICSQLGESEEASASFKELFQCTAQHPEYFRPEEIEKIRTNVKIFEEQHT